MIKKMMLFVLCSLINHTALAAAESSRAAAHTNWVTIIHRPEQSFTSTLSINDTIDPVVIKLPIKHCEKFTAIINSHYPSIEETAKSIIQTALDSKHISAFSPTGEVQLVPRSEEKTHVDQHIASSIPFLIVNCYTACIPLTEHMSHHALITLCTHAILSEIHALPEA
ncbi:hypothetical protein FJ365_00085 [Candidatus Dependentiae bacterium]|nr:hypothetical protein [Candidatus Dependentiae bacterium]